MNTIAFERIFNQRIEILKNILENRRNQYTQDGDRLSNFKDIALFTGESPLLEGLHLMGKHLICFRDSLRRCIKGERIKASLWSELFTDIHNYLFLMEALLVDAGHETVECDKNTITPIITSDSSLSTEYANSGQD